MHQWCRHVFTDDDLTPVRTARAVVRRVFDTWGLCELREDAELLVSEVVSNAETHGGGPALLTVGLSREAVLVEVRDRSPHGPRMRHIDPQQDESGRGLHIIEAVAYQSGVRPVPASGGKICWFTLRRG